MLTTNPDAIAHVIEQIQAHDVALAHGLSALAEEVAYAQILALLQDMPAR